jgi:hypothetical protein
VTSFTRTLLVAALITIGLGLLPITRRYAVWVGLIFLTVLYLRFKRTGGQ